MKPFLFLFFLINIFIFFFIRYGIFGLGIIDILIFLIDTAPSNSSLSVYIFNKYGAFGLEIINILIFLVGSTFWTWNYIFISK